MAGTAVFRRLVWQTGTVVTIQRETPTVVSLVIDLPDWPGHLAGQHVDVRLTAEDGYQAVRSYSIASPPSERLVTITVEEMGEGEVSPYLVEEVRPGDRLEFRGPIGGYFIWRPAMGGPLFLAGGGSGIVPLMAMLRERVATGSTVPVHLLYSVRSPQEIIYRADLERLAAEDGIEVTYTFTRQTPAGWTGFHRRVDPSLLAAVTPAPSAEPLAYVCGPTGFVEAASSALLALGHSADHIRTERFGPSGG